MDLIEAIEAAGIEYRNGRNADEYWLCCPFCTEKGESPDTRFRFGINSRTGKGHCFNCEWRGGGEKDPRGWDYAFKKLQEALATGEIEAAQKERHKHKHREKAELPEDFELLRPPNHHTHHETDHFNNMAWRYVRKRGVSEHQIKHKQIGYSLVDEMAYRVVFPVYVRSKLRGLVGRDFTGKQELPYRNSVGGKALYNVSDHPNKSVVLLEGVFDTLVVEQASKKLNIDANGLLGHDLTDDQLALIEPYKYVILWLDPDEAGLKGLLSIPKKIPKDKIVKAVLPRGFHHAGASDTDPSELESSVIVKRLLHAERLTPDLQLKLRAWSAFNDD